jgi:hypothetical protein
MKYCSHETQPPHIKVVTTSNESSELAIARSRVLLPIMPDGKQAGCSRRSTRLRAMDDRMLKQWGAAAARLCSPESNLGAQPREVFVVQLREARAEWRRRHPKKT